MKPPPTLAEFMALPEAERGAIVAERLSHMSDHHVAVSALGVVTKLVALDFPPERVIAELTAIVRDIRAGERLRLKRSQ